MPRLSCVGVHLFAQWLDQHETFRPVVAQLTQAVEAYKHAHPDEDFALLHHRESTLLQRFHALFFAPLLGIDRLPAFDTHEHPLATLLGRGYHRSTLSQFLGQLERVDAAEGLLPALVPPHTGSIGSVDGHMIAYWSRMSMHKGKIKPWLPMMTPGRPSWWRIIRPTSICRRSLWRTASGWPW
jgi:hypothetical protein